MPCCGALTFHISAAKWDFWGVINKVVVYFSTFGNIRIFCKKLYQNYSHLLLFSINDLLAFQFFPIGHYSKHALTPHPSRMINVLKDFAICVWKIKLHIPGDSQRQTPSRRAPRPVHFLTFGTIISYNHLVEVQSEEYFLCTLLSRALNKDHRFNDFISKVWQLWTYLAYAM